MKILYYDCFSGIAGDMHLAAMISLGVPEDYLINELKKLKLDGYEVLVKDSSAKGIAGKQVNVIVEEVHYHRKLKDITDIISESELSNAIIERSLTMFHNLARAEARVHGIDIQEVRFHEVGAMDAIIDIVGAAICIEYIKPDLIVSSSIELGSGFTKCEHGTFPVPPPAVVELLKGVPVSTGRQPFEATTPTGACIIVSNADKFEDLRNFLIEKTGYGTGSKESDIPNALRIILGETKPELEDSQHYMIECNIDDMNPEVVSFIMEQLFEAGADDVFLTPIIMKKSRNASKLSVLCKNILKEKMENLIIQETSTFGLRAYAVEKIELEREFTELETSYGTVRIKNALVDGKVMKSKPEYNDCARIARENNIALKDVYEIIKKLLYQ